MPLHSNEQHCWPAGLQGSSHQGVSSLSLDTTASPGAALSTSGPKSKIIDVCEEGGEAGQGVTGLEVLQGVYG